MNIAGHWDTDDVAAQAAIIVKLNSALNGLREMNKKQDVALQSALDRVKMLEDKLMALQGPDETVEN